MLIHVSEERTSSPLWLKAVERYHAELEGNGDYEDIIGVGSLEALLDHTKTIESLLPGAKYLEFDEPPRI